jgi:hypothetical protein
VIEIAGTFVVPLGAAQLTAIADGVSVTTGFVLGDGSVRLNLGPSLPVPIGGFSTEILPAIQPSWTVSLIGEVYPPDAGAADEPEGAGAITIQASPNLPAVLTDLSIGPSYTIRVYNGPTLAHQSSGHTGDIVAKFANVPPAPCNLQASLALNELTLGALFDDPTVFLIGPQGSPTVLGTRITVTTEQTQISGGTEPIPLGSLGRVELRGSGIETLDLTDLTVLPPIGCAGNCGGQSQTGCYCDAACSTFGDCCADVCQQCPGLPGCCPADINDDNQVNVNDLLAVVGNWGACVNPNSCPADVAPPGGDDAVNIADLLAVIANWGPCP